MNRPPISQLWGPHELKVIWQENAAEDSTTNVLWAEQNADPKECSLSAGITAVVT